MWLTFLGAPCIISSVASDVVVQTFQLLLKNPSSNCERQCAKSKLSNDNQHPQPVPHFFLFQPNGAWQWQPIVQILSSFFQVRCGQLAKFLTTNCSLAGWFSTLAYSEGVRGFKPPLNVRNFFWVVCLQNILPKLIKAYFLHENVKNILYTNFTFCFSFWVTSSHSHPTGALSLNPTGGFRAPGPAPTAWIPSTAESWVHLWFFH